MEDDVDVPLADVEERVVLLSGLLDEEIVDVIRLESEAEVIVDELVLEALVRLEVVCVWEAVADDVV